MQPWYWIGIYCMGVMFGAMYDHFIKNRNSENLTGAAKTLTQLQKRWKIRAILYIATVIFLSVDVYRISYHLMHPETSSQWSDAFYATYGVVLAAKSCALLTTIMLVGKLDWLRTLLSADMWQSLSNLMPTFNMLAPITCLWFYLSTSAPLNYTYVSQMFYYCGNLAFCFNFVLLISPISDLPTQTLIKMPYNLLAVRVGDQFKNLKAVMQPVTFKV